MGLDSKLDGFVHGYDELNRVRGGISGWTKVKKFAANHHRLYQNMASPTGDAIGVKLWHKPLRISPTSSQPLLEHMVNPISRQELSLREGSLRYSFGAYWSWIRELLASQTRASRNGAETGVFESGDSVLASSVFRGKGDWWGAQLRTSSVLMCVNSVFAELIGITPHGTIGTRAIKRSILGV